MEVFVESKRAYKSFRYRANTTWSSARRGALSAVGRANIVVGSPPEFKGDGEVWAPEELLVGSLNTCLMLTFLTMAQARGLTPAGYESEAEGLLENIEGKYRITEVTVRPRVVLKEEVTRACPQDHGRRRGPMLHLEFHQGQGEPDPGVCRRSKRVMSTTIGT
jgi:organic hydroperoxide reductase OsmC/OhrA